MKRSVPLLICAFAGFVVVVMYFIPATSDVGETVTMQFDILAGIAFVLGAGNLLKIQLKKVSDRKPGWGYSAVTLAAFVITLVIGLSKWGASPTQNQEYYGQAFTRLALVDIPASQSARVAGTIPQKANQEKVPLSVRTQLDQRGDQVVFHGWMQPNQREDLLTFYSSDAWRRTVEQLYEIAQPPRQLRNKVHYHFNHAALGFSGRMDDGQYQQLLAMGDKTNWRKAVESLHQASRIPTAVILENPPEGFNVPVQLRDAVTFDASTEQLQVIGPMSIVQRDALIEHLDSLVDDSAENRRWHTKVQELFQAAHVPKYPWSGDYQAPGTPFWWLYEYVFRPLTATMFALLGFFVASAAFRAFRAKNVEAILLLVSAFIILLGRTFAGVVLTDWLPENLEWLKIDSVCVFIMQVFNTAGNRAIMIGIALGLAATSLKVLLGIDRSYLGTRD